jgi:hypothetical protein
MLKIKLPLIILILFLIASCKSQNSSYPTLWESERLSGIFPLFTSLDFQDSPDGYYDLDYAHKNSQDEGDIQFSVSNGTNPIYYLVPANGAKYFLWGNREPSKQDCQQVTGQMITTKTTQLVEGDYYCVLTNNNNISRLKIIDFQSEMISLEFTTWKN